MSDFSVVDPAGLELGEHPIWDSARGRIGWVDVFGGTLRWAGDGEVELWEFSVPLGAAALRRDGGVVAAAGDGIHFRDRRGEMDREPITGFLPDGVRFNDGACDPDGRFLCGTMALDGQAGRGSLYRISPDGEVEVLATEVTESNGLAWSPDGETMYYVDSGEPVVRRYSYRPDGPPLRRPDLCEITLDPGAPDGLCVDSVGAVWLGIWEAALLWRISPDGQVLEEVVTPASRPTCPGFGGRGLERLFVATAWEGMDELARSREPWAGHLLATETPVPGMEAHVFAG